MPEGIDRLLGILAMDSSSKFCDLGSGIGRVVLHAAMHTPVAEAVGIELSDSRFEQAKAAAAVLSGLGIPTRPLRFVSADLGGCDLEAVTGGATHYFMCSTAFGAALCRSLAERLAAAPSFRVLVTSRALPPQRHLLKVGEVSGVEYSWLANGSAHVYVRDWRTAPPAVLALFWCRDGVCWGPPGPAPWRLGLVVEDEVVLAGAVGTAAHARAPNAIWIGGQERPDGTSGSNNVGDGGGGGAEL